MRQYYYALIVGAAFDETGGDGIAHGLLKLGTIEADVGADALSSAPRARAVAAKLHHQGGRALEAGRVNHSAMVPQQHTMCQPIARRQLDRQA